MYTTAASNAGFPSVGLLWSSRGEHQTRHADRPAVS